MKRLLSVIVLAIAGSLTAFAGELKSPDGTTPLMEAAFHDQLAEARRLIKTGADVTATNHYGVSALSLACQNGNAELVELLLEAGADPNTELHGGESALMTASRTGRPEIVRALIRRGATVDTTDWKQQSALMWAAAEGHGDVCQILLEAGADPNLALKSGFTPVLFAARAGQTEVIQILLDAGVDALAPSENNNRVRRGPYPKTTPLRMAIENGHFETAVFLLEAGANSDDPDSDLPPLHLLSFVRKPDRGDNEAGQPPPEGSGNLTSLEFARILIEDFGADVNLPLRRGNSGGPRFGLRGATPALLACHRADLPYLQLLHESGADLSIPNRDGVTPLLAVCGVGSTAPEEEAGTEPEAIAVARWLLDQGADINHLSETGETVMHGAAYRNWPELVHLLSDQGADIAIWNQKNKHRWTPFLIAHGYRSGNFKPSAATIVAIEEVMQEAGVKVPDAPPRR